jgi:anti-sigma regulatory factor (Ser/Thr protein kinase)
MDQQTRFPARLATQHLDGRRGAITAARDRAQEFFGECVPPLPPSAMDDVLVLVSELVTNAVRHAPGPGTLILADYRDRLTIAVSDGSSSPPVARTPDLASGTGGFGWHLLHRLAQRVDVSVHDSGGKTVTVTLDTTAGTGDGADGGGDGRRDRP